MENSLRKELNSFWAWAEITPEEYSNGETPKIVARAEWEEEYPNWRQLERSFRNELKNYKQNSDSSHLASVLEFLGIDNESGTALDALIEELNSTQQSTFSKLGYQFTMPQTRWQVAEFLSESSVPNKTDLLEEMISTDEDKYVQRRALLSLVDIAPELACKYACEKLRDEDEYLRLVSLRILKEQNSNHLSEATTFLRNDPSNLIQEELSKSSQ